MKINKKDLFMTTLVCILPMIFGAFVYESLPAHMPIHWNVSGKIDGYASKMFVVFGLPLLMVLLQWICLFFACHDPKKTNYPEKMKQLLLWIIPSIACILQIMTYLVCFGYDIAIETIVPVLVGIIFILIGNYLPKVKQNYTLGIRLPWTLNDKTNWLKTNRLTGYIMVIGGFAIIASFTINKIFEVFIGVIVILIVVPTAYSYSLYKKGNKHEN